jgi:hypothetical protein
MRLEISEPPSLPSRMRTFLSDGGYLPGRAKTQPYDAFGDFRTSLPPFKNENFFSVKAPAARSGYLQARRRWHPSFASPTIMLAGMNCPVRGGVRISLPRVKKNELLVEVARAQK